MVDVREVSKISSILFEISTKEIFKHTKKRNGYKGKIFPQHKI